MARVYQSYISQVIHTHQVHMHQTLVTHFALMIVMTRILITWASHNTMASTIRIRGGGEVLRNPHNMGNPPQMCTQLKCHKLYPMSSLPGDPNSLKFLHRAHECNWYSLCQILKCMGI